MINVSCTDHLCKEFGTSPMHPNSLSQHTQISSLRSSKLNAMFLIISLICFLALFLTIPLFLNFYLHRFTVKEMHCYLWISVVFKYVFLITIVKSALSAFIKNAKRRYFIACTAAVLYLICMLPYLLFTIGILFARICRCTKLLGTLDPLDIFPTSIAMISILLTMSLFGRSLLQAADHRRHLQNERR